MTEPHHPDRPPSNSDVSTDTASRMPDALDLRDSKSSHGRSRLGRPRSRNGCFTCRSRRVKCDESQPACTNCTKGGRDCSYIKSPTKFIRSSVLDFDKSADDPPDSLHESKGDEALQPDWDLPIPATVGTIPEIQLDGSPAFPAADNFSAFGNQDGLYAETAQTRMRLPSVTSSFSIQSQLPLSPDNPYPLGSELALAWEQGRINGQSVVGSQNSSIRAYSEHGYFKSPRKLGQPGDDELNFGPGEQRWGGSHAFGYQNTAEWAQGVASEAVHNVPVGTLNTLPSIVPLSNESTELDLPTVNDSGDFLHVVSQPHEAPTHPESIEWGPHPNAWSFGPSVPYADASGAAILQQEDQPDDQSSLSTGQLPFDWNDGSHFRSGWPQM